MNTANWYRRITVKKDLGDFRPLYGAIKDCILIAFFLFIQSTKVSLKATLKNM